MNEKIKSAMEKNKSAYPSVQRFAKSAYEALDEYYTKAKTAKQSAYDLTAKNIEDALKSAEDTALSKKAGAQQTYTQSQKNAYSSFAKAANDSGSVASAVKNAGLENSGYAQTLNAMNFSDYQQKLSEAHTALSQAVKDYDKQYIEALVSGDNEKAKLSLQLSQDNADLEKEINSIIASINSDIADMEYKAEAINNTKVMNDLEETNKPWLLQLTQKLEKLKQEAKK